MTVNLVQIPPLVTVFFHFTRYIHFHHILIVLANQTRNRGLCSYGRYEISLQEIFVVFPRITRIFSSIKLALCCFTLYNFLAHIYLYLIMRYFVMLRPKNLCSLRIYWNWRRYQCLLSHLKLKITNLSLPNFDIGALILLKIFGGLNFNGFRKYRPSILSENFALWYSEYNLFDSLSIDVLLWS